MVWEVVSQLYSLCGYVPCWACRVISICR